MGAGRCEEIEEAVRATVKRIGYEQHGFHWQTADFAYHLHAQSAHIAQGVDEAGNKDEGAGDQGIMFGFACDETPDLMPATLYYATASSSEMARDRHRGAAPFLEPDAKSQVTLALRGRQARSRATALVVSTQHEPGYDEGEKQAELHAYVKGVVADVMPARLAAERDRLSTSTRPAVFEIGGPDGDAGLTGRKIIVDTYGGAAPHGGGAFSGKDPTKVDRSAAYVSPLPRQEHRRRRPRQALHDPALLCDRRRRAAVALRRSARHRVERRRPPRGSRQVAARSWSG